MNITGIIVEYNPFHKGHLYHIKKTREITKSDGIIAVMSGNFVQRGQPALLDKWNRAKMALMNGVDLVLELPVIYSLSSAEFFANGAVSLLNNLGVTNNICFGSELGEVQLLSFIAEILNSEPSYFKTLLKKELLNGSSYPSARNKAISGYLGNFDFKGHNFNIPDLNKILNSPNNILGIEYCKSISNLKSNIKPFTIQRTGNNYNDFSLNGDFSSSTSIRSYIEKNSTSSGLEQFLPGNVYKLITNLQKSNYKFVFSNSMFPYIKYKYFSCNNNAIRNIPDVSEGIDNRIFKFLNNSTDINELINKVKTKRYTFTRISRILCQFFIGFENFDTEIMRKSECPYTRILGFNSTGLKILREIKVKSSIPVYTKLPANVSDSLALDIQSTKVYSLLNKNINALSDYLISPIIYTH